MFDLHITIAKHLTISLCEIVAKVENTYWGKIPDVNVIINGHINIL